MPIKKLVIKNIKSYVDEEINFSEGINCIIGRNGAGKSTIIESIGFAMFNSNKVTQGSLIRYGEKEGSITVTYEAQDGTDYTIYRKISRKGNGSCKITNLVTNEVIENVENVYPFVRKTLGIKQSKKISDLYEEIIAVPQGNFVSLFLETQAQRKEDFESLFNFDVYEKAYDKIKEIININDKNKNAVENETALIKGQTEDYDEVVKNIKELEDLNKEQETRLSEIEKDKDALSKDIDELKEQEKNINDIKEDIKTLENSIDSNNKLIKQKEKGLSDAQKALSIVKETEEDHKAYLRFLELIDKENERVEIYHKLKEELSESNEKITQLEGLINGEKKIISQDEMKIKGIDIDIEENEENLDKLKEDAKAKKADKKKVDDQYKDINLEIEGLENKQKALKESIVQYKLRYQETSKSKDIDINKENALLDELRKSEEKKNELEKDKEEITININKLEVVIDNLESNKEDLSCGVCPIFKETCKNLACKDKNNDFDALINDNKEQIAKLKQSEKDIKKVIKEFDNLDKDIIKCENAISEYNRYLDNVTNIIRLIKQENSGVDCIDDYDLLIAELQNRVNDLENVISKKKCDLKSIDDNRDNVTNAYNDAEKEVNNCKFRIETLKGHKKSAEEEIKKSDLEIARITTNLNSEKENNKEISKKSIDYVDAETNKKAYEKQRDVLQEKHDLYIANKTKSEEVETIIEEIEGYKKENIDHENSIENDKKSLEKYADFDAEILKKIEEKLKKIELEESKINGQLSANKIQLKTLKNKEKEKAKLLEKLSENEALISKYLEVENYLETTRKILRDLPIKLSLQYRDNISKMATIFYQRISKENVSVDIDETYRVSLIDNAKPDNVKEMNMLSGGEQMSLAIAIRVSMLKYLAGIDMYFLDEPTVNLDADRRNEIADVIKDVSVELKQLFVISHDDTFETITTSVLKVDKEDNVSKLNN